MVIDFAAWHCARLFSLASMRMRTDEIIIYSIEQHEDRKVRGE